MQLASLPYDILAVISYVDDPRSYRAISFRAIRMLALLRWPRLWRYIQKWVGRGGRAVQGAEGSGPCTRLPPHHVAGVA